MHPVRILVIFCAVILGAVTVYAFAVGSAFVAAITGSLTIAMILGQAELETRSVA